LRQGSESITGRLAYLELTLFLVDELPADQTSLQRLLLRGGFPLAYDAPGDDVPFI